jgi:hypothetical protein
MNLEPSAIGTASSSTNKMDKMRRRGEMMAKPNWHFANAIKGMI